MWRDFNSHHGTFGLVPITTLTCTCITYFTGWQKKITIKKKASHCPILKPTYDQKPDTFFCWTNLTFDCPSLFLIPFLFTNSLIVILFNSYFLNKNHNTLHNFDHDSQSVLPCSSAAPSVHAQVYLRITTVSILDVFSLTPL